MRYLITGNGEPYLTDWFTIENNYIECMTVYDLRNEVYTTDRINWKEIIIDTL